jgi:hypothetical protein
MAECLAFLDRALGAAPNVKYGSYWIGVSGDTTSAPVTLGGTVADGNSNSTDCLNINSGTLIGSGGKLVIRGMGEGASIGLTQQGSLLYLADGAGLNVVLENVTLDGLCKGGVGGHTAAEENGLFAKIVGAGLAIDASDNNSTLVYVGSNNTLTTENAYITGNVYSGAEYFAAGVTLCDDTSKFYMRGGGVTYNVNTVDDLYSGGGVGIGCGSYGGGYFEMSDGAVISYNSTKGSGGGINGYNGSYKISGAEISGNGSYSNMGNMCGGVFIKFESAGQYRITMSDSQIIDNTSLGVGGGIYIHNKNPSQLRFDMTNCAVNRNTSTFGQGGGLVLISGVVGNFIFNMSGGEISANTANSNCGGMILSQVYFNMSGGAAIKGNLGKGGVTGTDAGGLGLSGSCQVKVYDSAIIYGNPHYVSVTDRHPPANAASLPGDNCNVGALGSVAGEGNSTINGVRLQDMLSPGFTQANGKYYTNLDVTAVTGSGRPGYTGP